MPAPPLWASSLELADAVNTIATQHDLTLEERRWALEVLGGIIATGETSHVRCLQRVADAIAAGHDRLAEIAQECSTRAGASIYRGTGSKPVTQEVLRWDQEA